jgi:predicted nucleotidyltransferase
LFNELGAIAQKTFALAVPLRQALAPFVPQIRAAFVFGSVAKRKDTASSDIDLMVVSESLGMSDLIEALYPIEPGLGRPVNPVVLTSAEFERRRKDGSFLQRVSTQPKLWIVGGEDDLPA